MHAPREQGESREPGRLYPSKTDPACRLPWVLAGPQLGHCIRAQAPPAPLPSPVSLTQGPQALPHLVKSPELFDL